MANLVYRSVQSFGGGSPGYQVASGDDVFLNDAGVNMRTGAIAINNYINVTAATTYAGNFGDWEWDGLCYRFGTNSTARFDLAVLGVYCSFREITLVSKYVRVALWFSAWFTNTAPGSTDKRIVWFQEIPPNIEEPGIGFDSGPLNQYSLLNERNAQHKHMHPTPIDFLPPTVFYTNTTEQMNVEFGIAVHAPDSGPTAPSNLSLVDLRFLFDCGLVTDLNWPYGPQLVLPPHIVGRDLNPVRIGNTSPKITVAYPEYFDVNAAFAHANNIDVNLIGQIPKPPELVETVVISGSSSLLDTDSQLYRKVQELDSVNRGLVTTDLAVPDTGFTIRHRNGDNARMLFQDANWLTPWATTLTDAAAPKVPHAPVVTKVDNADHQALTVTSLDNLLPVQFTYNKFTAGKNGNGTANNTMLEAETNTSVTYAANLVATAAIVDQMEYTPQVQRTGGATGTASALIPGFYPAVAGVSYRALGTAARTVSTGDWRLQIDWYNAAFGLISTSTMFTVNINAAPPSIFPGSGIATAPANTVWFRVRLLADNMTSGSGFAQFGRVSVRREDASLGSTVYGQGGYIGTNMLQNLGHGGNKIETGLVEVQTEIQQNAYITSVLDNASAARSPGASGIRITKTANTTIATNSPSTPIVIWDLASSYLPERLPTGTTVTLSAYVKSAAYTTPTAIGIRFFNRYNLPMHSAEAVGNPVTMSTSFQQVSVTATVPEGASRFAVVLWVPSPNSASTIDWDDFHMEYGSAVTYIPTTGYSGRPASTPGEWALIERKVTSAGDWAVIAVARISPTTQQATYSDYCVTPGTSVFYRARVMGHTSGSLVYSAYSAEISRAVSAPGGADAGRWAIRDPEGQLAFYFDMEGGPGLKETWNVDDAVFHPIGQDRPIVVADTGLGNSFTVNMNGVTAAEIANFKNLHENRRVIFLGRPWTGEWWPVQLTGNVQVTELNTNPVMYKMVFTMEEVNVPSVW
jgi:hypothetical protein